MSHHSTSEIDNALYRYPSAWIGHKDFATWLVQKVKANTVVDLGVDFGFSTFCFALAGAGHVFSVDSFKGDEHAGRRNTYKIVHLVRDELKLKNVTFIKGYFNDVAATWSQDIDILHIDGRHRYDDIRSDYHDWVKFVAGSGFVLLHDTCVEHFGVRRFLEK